MVERELVGGECSYWACIPSKTLLRPGEAVQAARDVAATARVDVQAALAWRDFMVSEYSDAGQQRWLKSKGIDLLRGSGTLAGPGVVEVDGVHHTARHMVVATGSDPVLPPIPGLLELEDVWTSREATGMAALPRRLLVLAADRWASSWPRPCVDWVPRSCSSRAPDMRSPGCRRRWARLGAVLRRDGVDLVVGTHATSARRDGTDYVLTLDNGRELRGDRLLVATGRRPRVPAGLETVGVTAGPRGIPVDARLRAGERLWAIGDATACGC